MKKKSILFVSFILCCLQLFATQNPTVIYPNPDGFHISAGYTNFEFRVRTNVRKCGGYAVLYYYNPNTNIKTVVPGTTPQSYYSKKSWNHQSVFFNIPTCSQSSQLCIGFTNIKNGSPSAEVF